MKLWQLVRNCTFLNQCIIIMLYYMWFLICLRLPNRPCLWTNNNNNDNNKPLKLFILLNLVQIWVDIHNIDCLKLTRSLSIFDSEMSVWKLLQCETPCWAVMIMLLKIDEKYLRRLLPRPLIQLCIFAERHNGMQPKDYTTIHYMLCFYEKEVYF